jgi:hypothetical protein
VKSEIINRPNCNTTGRQLGSPPEVGNCEIGLSAFFHEKWLNGFKKRQTFAVGAKVPAVELLVCRDESLSDSSSESVLVAGQSIAVCSGHRHKYSEGVATASFEHPYTPFAIEVASEVLDIWFPCRHHTSIEQMRAKSKPAERVVSDRKGSIMSQGRQDRGGPRSRSRKRRRDNDAD